MSAGGIATLRDLKISALSERGGLCWPTLILANVIFAALVVQTWLAATGVIPLWAGTLLNTFWMIQGYAPGHEAVHRNIHGRDERFRWINGVIGRSVFFCALHSFTMHEHVHRMHHAHLNDPEKDIDEAVIHAPGFWSAFLRSFLFYPHTKYHGLRIAKYHPRPKAFLAAVAAELAVPYAILIALVVMGYGKEVLFLWILPTILTFSGVVMFVGWLPHHLEKTDNPLRATRVIEAPQTVKGRLATWLYNYHNYHLVHHLFPAVPWTRLERVYRRGKHVLEKEGALISPL